MREKALAERVPELQRWALDGKGPSIRYLADDGRVLATVEVPSLELVRASYVMACLQGANLEVILTVTPSGQGLSVDEVEPNHIAVVDMYWGNGLTPDVYVWCGVINQDHTIDPFFPYPMGHYLDRVVHAILQTWHWARSSYSPANLVDPQVSLTDMLDEWERNEESKVTRP